LSAWLIDACGWRFAYVALGLLPLVLVWPIVYLFFFDNAAGQDQRSLVHQRAAHPLGATGITLAEAAKGWRFWALNLFVLGAALTLGGALPNVESILKSNGSSTSEAISIAQLIGVSIVIGRLSCGWLLDKIKAWVIALVSLFAAALALAYLSQPDLPWIFRALSIALLGAAAGMETDFMAFLVARYFGLRHYGAIYGVLYGMYAVCTGIGATVYGASFDRTASFSSILMCAAAVLALASIIPLTLGKYVYVKPEVAASLQRASITKGE
jgi:predicted MFS family arabinose efflux permease